MTCAKFCNDCDILFLIKVKRYFWQICIMWSIVGEMCSSLANNLWFSSLKDVESGAWGKTCSLPWCHVCIETLSLVPVVLGLVSAQSFGQSGKKFYRHIKIWSLLSSKLIIESSSFNRTDNRDLNNEKKLVMNRLYFWHTILIWVHDVEENLCLCWLS